MQNFIERLPSVPWQSLREKSFLHVPRTVLGKVSCFGTPRTAWYKRGRFVGNIKYKLAFLSQPVFSGTKAKLQTCLPKVD